MTANLEIDNQNLALCAASQIFMETYTAAKSADGAFERIYEKTKNLYDGIKNRRSNFISTEAIIHVTAIHRKISYDEAKLHHNSKSEDDIKKTKQAIQKKEKLWREARHFDKTNHDGQQYVNQHQEETKIIFLISDNRKLEFDLQRCSNNMQSWLSSIEIPPKINKIIETSPVIKEKISEITKWPDNIIKQSLASLTTSEKDTLCTYHHLSQFKSLLISEERKINKPINKITSQDISEILLTLLDKFDEEEIG